MGTLMNLPLSVPVVAGWGFWLATGLVLLVWARRTRDADLHAHSYRTAAAGGRAAQVRSACRKAGFGGHCVQRLAGDARA